MMIQSVMEMLKILCVQILKKKRNKKLFFDLSGSSTYLCFLTFMDCESC